MIDQITRTKGEFLREKIPLQITNYSITRIGGGFWHLKIKINQVVNDKLLNYQTTCTGCEFLRDFSVQITNY